MRRKPDIDESESARRDLLDEDGRGPGLAALFALSAMAVIGTAVLYNAVFAQKGGPLRVAAGIESPATAVHLTYDPVVEAVQRELLAAGYYKGLVDGVAGQRTRRAIAAYQQATGTAVTGAPSEDLADRIRFTREVAEASLFTGSTAAGQGGQDLGPIRRVQTGLAELAYEPGPIDGALNPRTREAIRRFERDRGLPETGEIGAALLAELAKTSGQSEIAAGP